MRDRWRAMGLGIGLAALTGCVVAEPAVVATPPPAPAVRLESVPPPPAPTYVWTPGYWAWRGPYRGYIWIPGRYVVPEQPGLVWVPGYWGRSAGGWVWVEGHWRGR